jgi:hypothetical protein
MQQGTMCRCTVPDEGKYPVMKMACCTRIHMGYVLLILLQFFPLRFAHYNSFDEHCPSDMQYIKHAPWVDMLLPAVDSNWKLNFNLVCNNEYTNISHSTNNKNKQGDDKDKNHLLTM